MKNFALFYLFGLLCFRVTTVKAQETCPERDPNRFDCQTSCTPNPDTNGGCRVARKCECDGTCGWSCIRKGCPSLSVPVNDEVDVNPVNRSIGSTATFTCHGGFNLRGTSTRTCQEDKTLSEGDDASCECARNEEEVNRLGLSCGRPCPNDGTCLKATFPCICDGYCGMSCIDVGRENYCSTSDLIGSHATYTVDSQTAEYGSIAKYTYNDGFSAEGGNSVRTCSGGRRWDGSAIVCWPNRGCDSSNGWLEYERHCYKLISPSGDYGAIEQLCLATGPSPGGVKISSLADVQSQAENDFIAEVVAGGNRAWIAGARYGTDNWIWSLNNRVGVSMGVSYTNWKPNAPDNHLDQEGCIEINRGPAGKWNDLKCTKKRPGVCKYSIDQWKTSIDQLNPGQTKKI